MAERAAEKERIRGAQFCVQIYVYTFHGPCITITRVLEDYQGYETRIAKLAQLDKAT